MTGLFTWFSIEFCYNVVIILPVNWLLFSHNLVSAVRAPIWLGIAPVKMVQNGSTVSTWRSVEANYLPVKALVLKDRYESVWFSGNILVIASPMSPTKNNKISICDFSVYVIFHRVLVQCRSNLTWQRVVAQTQICQFRQSSDLAGNRACQNSSKWQYS